MVKLIAFVAYLFAAQPIDTDRYVYTVKFADVAACTEVLNSDDNKAALEQLRAILEGSVDRTKVDEIQIEAKCVAPGEAGYED